MFQTLLIQNLATIQEQKIHFRSGFQVVTGSSGAGKSLLFTAISLVFGAKADTHFIRPGCDSASVTLQLEFQGETLELRRQIFLHGTSRAYYNQRAISRTKLQELGRQLLEWHLQHQALELLNLNTQRILVDLYGQHEPLLVTIGAEYQEIQRLRNALELLHHPSEAEKELLAYQLEELEHFAPLSHEYTELLKEEALLNHASSSIQTLEEALQSHVLEQSYQLEKQLQRMPAPAQPKQALELLKQATIYLEESFAELRFAKEHISDNPERLTAVTLRLEGYTELARKHKVLPEALFAHYQTLNSKQAKILAGVEKERHLRQALAETMTRYQHTAMHLHQARTQSAGHFAHALVEHLKPLGLPEIKCTIAVHATNEVTSFGSDRIEWQVSMNPGHPLQPLHQVSSGGELSRLSLVASLLTAQQRALPVLLLDEIDTGLGGDIAHLLGEMLKALGKHTQILCISHAASLAFCADHHLLAEKYSKEGHTFSEFHWLNAPMRLNEQKRLLGTPAPDVEFTKNA